jgi:bifunctional DNase/RNase
LEGLQRARDVSVFLGVAGEGAARYIVVGMQLHLEDGRTFTMINIPVEVALAVKAIRGEGEYPVRKSLFDLLANYEPFKEELARTLRKVVIDELDPNTGLYTATVEFEDEGLVSRVKMIPSHAVFLALLVDAPIYVREDFIDEEDFLEEGGGE